MLIYQILENGYLGAIAEVPDNTIGIPFGYTRTPVPLMQDGEYAYWRGTHWEVTSIAPKSNDFILISPVEQGSDTVDSPIVVELSTTEFSITESTTTEINTQQKGDENGTTYY